MRKNNKDTILSAARRLFLKFGYNGISMRSIAREAKLTTGAVYFHFKNKMDIYRAICYEAIDILVGDFRVGIERGAGVSQKLISTFDSYIRFFYDHLDHYNILMEYKGTYGTEGEGDKNGITGKMSELTGMIQEAISLGVHRGEMRSLDSIMLSMFLASVAEGMLQYKKMGLFDFYGIKDKDFRKFMADVVGRGIQTGT